MAGRAGRPGFAPVGRSILYAETPLERERLFRHYTAGQPEGVRSSFDPSQLDTWLIRLLRQVRRIEEDKVSSLLANTFGGFCAALRDPQWTSRMERDLAIRLNRMRKLGLLEDFRGKLALTRLGEACGQSSLSLDSCMYVVEMLRANGPVTATELMGLVQCLDEAAAVYTPLKLTKTGKDRGWGRLVSGAVRQSILHEMKRGSSDEDFERRCKRMAILLDWIGGVAMVELETSFTTNPFFAVALGTVQAIANTTRFHLRSASEIARVVSGDASIEEAEIAVLLERLERGLPLDSCEVARHLPMLMREEILALRSLGITSMPLLAGASDEVLRSVVRDSERVRAIRASLTAEVASDRPQQRDA